MGFSLGGALGGGSLGSIISGPIGAGAGALFGSGLTGKNPFSPNSNTQNQIPLETPEQKKAREMLLEFAKTGAFGKFNAGQDLGLGYGDFNATPIEQQGLTQVGDLLSSGIPDQFRLGDDALKDILATSPDAIESQFSPFKSRVQREVQEGADAFKRNSAFSGNLYSTATNRGLGDIYSRGNETLASQLAELTNQFMNRRLQAVPLAIQSGQAQEGIRQNRIGTAFQYGALPRVLNDSAIKARDAEIVRRRQELALPIQAAQTVSGQNANFGVPSVTTSSPSTLMQLLQIAGPIAGNVLGRMA